MFIYVLIGITIAVIGILGLAMPGKLLSRFSSILAIIVGAGVVIITGQQTLKNKAGKSSSADDVLSEAFSLAGRRKRRQKRI